MSSILVWFLIWLHDSTSLGASIKAPLSALVPIEVPNFFMFLVCKWLRKYFWKREDIVTKGREVEAEVVTK